MPRLPRPRYETCRKLHAPSDCKLWSSTPAPASRSRRPSPRSCATGPTLFVGADAFFNSRRVQLANMAARHAIPTAFAVHEYVDAGGLMSYGTSLPDMYRLTGF